VSNRLIAIGDIHGCSVALRAIITAIDPQPDDTIVTLGDYVDRGPDTRGVVELLIDLGLRTRLVALLGNHEEMMLQVLRGEQPHQAWLRFGGVETLESYQFDGNLDFLPPEHLKFFESLVDYYVQDNYLFTHAAYDPQLPFDQQPADVLRWHSLRDGIPQPHFSGVQAVVGHTASHNGEVLDVGHLLCIDTYCYGGGYLTALDVHNRAVWQVTREGYLR
jgi:serine/threonine protein phosphatase 1